MPVDPQVAKERALSWTPPVVPTKQERLDDALGDMTLRAIEAQNQSIEYQRNRPKKDEFELVKRQVVDVGKTWGSTILGAPADLIAVAGALGDNAINVAKGGSWNWPENFDEVPATSDWYASQAGLDTSSIDYILGSVIAPGVPTKTAGIGGAVALARLGKTEKLTEFEAAEKAGRSVEELKKSTGLYRGTDGNIKFAFSDANMKVRDVNALVPAKEIADMEVGKSVPKTFRLDQVVEHDSLFEIYPQLRNYSVVLATEKLEDGTVRVFDPNAGNRVASFERKGLNETGTLKLNKGYNPRTSVMHEIQHAIQEIEGFSFGANSAPYLNALDLKREATQSRSILKALESSGGDMEAKELVNMLQRRGFSTEAIEANFPLINSARRSLQDGDPSVLDDAYLFYNTMEDKALNKLGTMYSSIRPTTSTEDTKKLLRKMSVYELQDLIEERYLRQGGEVEARLVEALIDVRQEKLDEMLLTPEQLLKTEEIGDKVGNTEMVL